MSPAPIPPAEESASTSGNDENRSTLADRIAARRADPDFARRLRATMERNKRALERLGE